MPDGVSSLPKPLIMVVEDEAALATMLRYNLEKQGFRVEEAADGQEALNRIAETRPDLVLLDWMLPTMSGIEVCRQLRRRPNTRDLPVIMVTARVEDQDAVRALNTGADDYVTKPFSIEALMARMRALLRRSSTMPVKDAVWGPDIHVEPRTVDVHIRRLRKSINGEGELDLVRTVRTAGYALDTEPV
jgi:two-component system phosphate regulon response regulator PhoB